MKIIAYDILAKTLASRQRESLYNLSAAVVELSNRATSRYAQVRLLDHSDLEIPRQGWVIGSFVGAGSGKNTCVVFTTDRKIWAGHLTIRHDAAEESTVTATVRGLDLDDLITNANKDEDHPPVAQSSRGLIGYYDAIAHVLNRPEALAAHLELTINPRPLR